MNDAILERCAKADAFHNKGYNCCQSTVAAFADLVGVDENTLLHIASGFGGGMGNGEICGAITGAVMALNLLSEMDHSNPGATKRKSGAQARELQKRFEAQFGYLRCRDLLKNQVTKQGIPAAAQALGLQNHCHVMVVTAVELVQQMLAEQEQEN